jgi:hypothetical protein
MVTKAFLTPMVVGLKVMTSVVLTFVANGVIGDVVMVKSEALAPVMVTLDKFNDKTPVLKTVNVFTTVAAVMLQLPKFVLLALLAGELPSGIETPLP